MPDERSVSLQALQETSTVRITQWSIAVYISLFLHNFAKSIILIFEGPRTRVGQPKTKYWKVHELHKNEVASQ